MFEGVIAKYLVDNPHRLTVEMQVNNLITPLNNLLTHINNVITPLNNLLTPLHVLPVQPSTTLQKTQDDAETARLAAHQAGLSPEDMERLVAETAALKKHQVGRGAAACYILE